MKIAIYNEYSHNQLTVGKKAYANGLHKEIGSIFDGCADFDEVRYSTQKDLEKHTENDVTYQSLKDIDVLYWWGHIDHAKVPDAVVDAIEKRVREGMGIVVLHSGHFSKVLQRLLGTPCSLVWREAREAERIWTASPMHPIAQGVEQGFRLNAEEMYGEHFNIPSPDEVVFIGWYQGGNVFRSGVTFHLGEGRIFYFQPGHETFPTYKNANVRLILKNAAYWCCKQENKISTVNVTYRDAPCEGKAPEQIHRLHLHGRIKLGKEIEDK